MIIPDNDSTRREAAKIIAEGGVIAFRTDTFYGLGANPLNAAAVQKIRELKGREDDKPILLLISDADQTDRFIIERTETFEKIARRHWPGPITLVAQARAELPQALTAGSGSIGVRLPGDDSVRELVRECGGALTATSANASGQTPARNPREVENYFGDKIDVIIDSGEVKVTQPSTVLDVTRSKGILVREGAISREQLEDVL